MKKIHFVFKQSSFEREREREIERERGNDTCQRNALINRDENRHKTYHIFSLKLL